MGPEFSLLPMTAFAVPSPAPSADGEVVANLAEAQAFESLLDDVEGPSVDATALTLLQNAVDDRIAPMPLTTCFAVAPVVPPQVPASPDIDEQDPRNIDIAKIAAVERTPDTVVLQRVPAAVNPQIACAPNAVEPNPRLSSAALHKSALVPMRPPHGDAQLAPTQTAPDKSASPTAEPPQPVVAPVRSSPDPAKDPQLSAHDQELESPGQPSLPLIPIGDLGAQTPSALAQQSLQQPDAYWQIPATQALTSKPYAAATPPKAASPDVPANGISQVGGKAADISPIPAPDEPQFTAQTIRRAVSISLPPTRSQQLHLPAQETEKGFNPVPATDWKPSAAPITHPVPAPDLKTGIAPHRPQPTPAGSPSNLTSPLPIVPEGGKIMPRQGDTNPIAKATAHPPLTQPQAELTLPLPMHQCGLTALTTVQPSLAEGAFNIRVDTVSKAAVPDKTVSIQSSNALAPEVRETAEQSRSIEPPKADPSTSGTIAPTIPEFSAADSESAAQIAPSVAFATPDPLPMQPHRAEALPNVTPPNHPPAIQQILTALQSPKLDQPNRIDIVLAPAELGGLRFDMQPDGAHLHVTLSAERAETLDMVRRHIPELLAELRQAGFQGASLSFGQWTGPRGQPPPPPVAATEAGEPAPPFAPERLHRPLPAMAIAQGSAGLDLRI